MIKVLYTSENRGQSFTVQVSRCKFHGASFTVQVSRCKFHGALSRRAPTGCSSQVCAPAGQEIATTCQWKKDYELIAAGKVACANVLSIKPGQVRIDPTQLTARPGLRMGHEGRRCDVFGELVLGGEEDLSLVRH